MTFAYCSLSFTILFFSYVYILLLFLPQFPQCRYDTVHIASAPAPPAAFFLCFAFQILELYISILFLIIVERITSASFDLAFLLRFISISLCLTTALCFRVHFSILSKKYKLSASLPATLLFLTRALRLTLSDAIRVIFD